MKQSPYVYILLLLSCLTYSQAEKSDVTTSASPSLSLEDTIKTFRYVEQYVQAVDSLYTLGQLEEYFHPHKTRVGSLYGYSINGATVFLLGRGGGEKAKSRYRVYLERGALRKIVHTRREVTEEQADVLLRSGEYFDDTKHAYTETTHEIYLGKVLQFRTYKEGSLISQEENLSVKRQLVEEAERMLAIVQAAKK